MISLNEQVAIAASPDTVWPLLRDPALVGACIPGAALTASGDDGAYRGTIRVKFGPTVAIFRGEARLVYDDEERRCTIEGRGIDGRGASRALASGVVTAIGARASGTKAGGVETTRIKCEGNFNVTGPLETFANAGGVHLARALLAEFAGNLARLAAERTALNPEPETAPDGVSPQPSAREAGRGSEQSQNSAPVAAELRGGTLLWRAFLGWLKQLVFAKGKA
ncbi:MAG: SRPBCC family protein [Stellaceae bacterium]